MHQSRLATLPSLSPHKLFQELHKAVETDNSDDTMQLVDALVDVLRGGQTLAESAVAQLHRLALRRGCGAHILAALSRLPRAQAR